MSNPAPPKAIARDLRRLADTPGHSLTDAYRDGLRTLADLVAQLDQPATVELDAVAGGLDPEQEIRARAAQAAATALGPTLAAATPMTMQQFDVARERLLDLSQVLIGLIREGSRP